MQKKPRFQFFYNLDFTISNQNKETNLDHYLFIPDD